MLTSDRLAAAEAQEFTEVLADSPCRLFAGVTRDGSVWEYRSIIVRDDADLRRPVRERLDRDGYSLTEQREYADPGVMFGRAVERVYR
ncbi:hypothetical protein [Amycolatopsis dongchuanensis]|uniref:Uncharacterized protein n=1 Tax=Amycolatopsis dongchuanensis TaxID=1070866 RepID=A0ABP9Q742_9PSEU